MPKLNGIGLEGNGSKTGRGLGECEKKSYTVLLQKLGKGISKRIKSGGGEGRGKRLKYDL
ncbi:DUF5320 family protein [Draconibacterium orientale]|uniref:DUF5320 family protein n=1 Tax=Draconibacterium orientale TaxID=1168034 RepID=UPI002A0A246C|nr:DUF5320 family protein [Draconibacterium orientale]